VTPWLTVPCEALPRHYPGHAPGHGVTVAMLGVGEETTWPLVRLFDESV
jgi:hypothetical protein